MIMVGSAIGQLMQDTWTSLVEQWLCSLLEWWCNYNNYNKIKVLNSPWWLNLTNLKLQCIYLAINHFKYWPFSVYYSCALYKENKEKLFFYPMLWVLAPIRPQSFWAGVEISQSAWHSYVWGESYWYEERRHDFKYQPFLIYAVC